MQVPFARRVAPNVRAVQEGIYQAGLLVDLQVAFHREAGKAYLQEESQHYPAAERGMAASLEVVGRQPCAVAGMVACSGGHHRGLEAYHLAEGKVAFHLVAWALLEVSTWLCLFVV